MLSSTVSARARWTAPRATTGIVGRALLGRALASAGAVRPHLTWGTRRGEHDHPNAQEVSHEVLPPQGSATREQRELLHELRSTMAGLVSGSVMLDNPDVPPEARQRLWESMRRELDRMDRLLSGRMGQASEIDLDEALEPILELQRLKGRHVEVRGAGDVVQGRYDALAEVLNILVDNAATHGGVDHSVVEVVRRDEETVDIRVSDEGRGIPPEQRERIFDWGLRGEDSPGEGIGLNLAQRLMVEDGGSLRLAEHEGTGSSFVITLPAARRPADDVPPGSRRAWTY
jgi:signal transduction histidine kinase